MKSFVRKIRILSFCVCVLLVGLPSISQAQLIVYEGFNYYPSFTNSSEWPGVSGYDASTCPQILHGEPFHQGGTLADTNAIGLDETWVEENVGDKDNLFLKTGSLSFGDLPTAGNRAGFANNLDWDINHRPLTAKAQSSIGGATGIWFSVLTDKTYNRYGAYGGFVLGNKIVASTHPNNLDGSDGLQGFGFAPPSESMTKWTAFAWNGVTQFVGSASIDAGPVRLMVGLVSLDTGPAGKDEYSLYYYELNDGSVEGGTLNQIGATIEFDMDQTSLNRIHFTRSEATDYDELRIGTTLDSVLGVPPPAGMVLIIR